MSHHHSRFYQAAHNPEAQRLHQEFKRISEEAIQYVNAKISAASITLRAEERSYLVYTYIIDHTTEQAVLAHYKLLLSQMDARVANNIQQQILSYKEYVTRTIQNIPADNPLHIQGEQALEELKIKAAALQPFRGENLTTYMELGKEGSTFIDQKVAAGDIRPLTTDEHTKLVNQYIEYQAEIPAVKTYAETMEASIDAKIEYDAHEAERYIAYKKHHEHHHKNLFLYNVFKVVAIGCAAVFAPPLAASIGGFGMALATGATCAATDAACQKAGMALGYQSKFSINEVLETGVSCGVGSAAAGLSTIPRALAQAGSCTGTQIAELAADLRKEFDLAAVGLQAGASVVSSAVNSSMPNINETINETAPNLADTVGKENTTILASTLVNNVTIAALESMATGNSFNLENLGANLVGSFINNKVSASVNEQEISEQPAEESKITQSNPNTNPDTALSINQPTPDLTQSNLDLDGICLIENSPHLPTLPSELFLKNFMTLVDVTLHQIQLAKAEPAKIEIESPEELEDPQALPDIEIQGIREGTAESDEAWEAGAKEAYMKDLRDKLHATIPDKSIYDQALPVLEEAVATAAAATAIAGALAALPEGIATGMLTIISRLSASLFTCGPVSEVLIADELAAEAAGYLPATAVGAATIGAVSKALSKFSMFRKASPIELVVSDKLVIDSGTKTVNVIEDVLKNAKPTPGKPNQLEAVLDDGTKVIFRRDIGEYAHEIKRGTGVKVDHFNIEIQVPGAKPGRFNSIENLHIVVDENLKLVEAFTSKNGVLRDVPKLFNQPRPG